MRIVLHPEASAELRAVARWYNERRMGLGAEFLDEVSATFSRVEAAPQSFVRWPGTKDIVATIRRALLHRFPFAIAFEEHQHHVLVLAVAHAKRRPLYWLARATLADRGPI